ncbi:MAG: barstar family protein [Bacteroidota bacterium]
MELAEKINSGWIFYTLCFFLAPITVIILLIKLIFWVKNKKTLQNSEAINKSDSMMSIINEYSDKGYYIALLDAVNCPTLNSFVIQIGVAFRFPSYYGKNMNALDECINDLDWLEEKNYVLVVSHSKLFLAKETKKLREEMWQLLEKVRFEWASVPNYDGEDMYREKADFVIIRQ